MPQPPSFPFYAGDWIAGTATLGLAEKGAYIDCLAHQWTSGDGVPGDDPVALARIVRSTPAEARKVWAAIGRKFTKGDDGLYRNPRIERERETKARYYQSKSENGSKGGRPRKSDTKPIGLAPSPSPSPSEPTVQGDAPVALRVETTGQPVPRRRGYGDPFGQRLNPGSIYAIVSPAQKLEFPPWWTRRQQDRHGFDIETVEAFALWLAADVRAAGGKVNGPGEKFDQWLDGRWAAWRQTVEQPNDGARPAGELIAELDQQAARIPKRTPEQVQALLRGKPVAS